MSKTTASSARSLRMRAEEARRREVDGWGVGEVTLRAERVLDLLDDADRCRKLEETLEVVEVELELLRARIAELEEWRFENQPGDPEEVEQLKTRVRELEADPQCACEVNLERAERYAQRVAELEGLLTHDQIMELHRMANEGGDDEST